MTSTSCDAFDDYNQTCTIPCLPGWQAQTATIVCGADQQWSSSVPCQAETTHCNDSVPNLSGANMNALGSNDFCDGTPTDSTCSHSCNHGYEGGSITCSDGAGGSAYVVSACTADADYCDGVEPSLTGGDNMESIGLNGCAGTAFGAACSHSCNHGYEGGSVTCSDNGSGTPQYDVVGCAATENYCDSVEPSGLGGNNIKAISANG